MHKIITIIFLLLLGHTLATASEQLTPQQVAQKVYDRYIGDDMQMRGRMDLISKKGHVRTREFLSLSKDSDTERKQLIRFTAPADISGTGFLTLEKKKNNKTDQHLYLPALKRTRRIVASQKGRSFVNSDFTYEDMQRHPVENWDYHLDSPEKLSGSNCYVLISTPKPDTKTQYSKMMTWVEMEHFMPLKTVSWNKKGERFKIYSVNKFDIIDNIATATDVFMEDLLSEHKTRLKTQEIIYNSNLKDSLFTIRALER